MAFVNPFKEPGQWYKGNTHSHSDVSDGRLSIEERFAQFRDAGYGFLVLTDHGKVSDISSEDSPGEFLAISGSELHPKNPYGGSVYHFVAINVHEPIETRDLHPNEVIERIREQDGEAILCHPYWCGHTILDLMPLHGYLGVEVFNTTCTGIGKGFSEPHWDDLMDKMGPTWGLAVDDCHGTEHDVFQGWINVRSEKLEQPDILDALRRGAFYSSMGPEILDLDIEEIEVEGDAAGAVRFQVQCTPAARIAFVGCRSTGRQYRASEGELLTQQEYIAKGSERYIRIEITDPTGKKAWTNPFWL